MSFVTSLPVRKERNDTVQVFRALAIIAVVMIHTVPHGEWQVIVRPFVNFSVATFIFLSGYFTRMENDNWRRLYKRRVVRVIVPYIVWSVLYTLPTMFRQGIDGTSVLARNIITTEACYHLYYIFVYIQFVLLPPLLFWLAKSKYRNLGWIISPVSLLLFKYIPWFWGTTLNKYVAMAWSVSCLGWFAFYYLGLLLGNGLFERRFKMRTLLVGYGLSLFLQMGEGYCLWLLGEANCGTQLKLSSLLSGVLFALIVHEVLLRKKNFGGGFMEMLGDYSFGIYLCHPMVMIFIRHFVLFPFPINAIIVLLVSLGCCYVGSKMCGKKWSAWLGLR